MDGEATRSPHRLVLQSTRTECCSRELLIGTVLTLAGGYGSRCQRRDTVSPGSREPLRRRSAKLCICLRSQSSLAAKVMEMKLHRLRDVRSDYGLLKQHG